MARVPLRLHGAGRRAGRIFKVLLPTRFWSEMSWTDFDEADMGDVIAAADEHGMAMVFTGVRHFRH